VIHHAEPRYTKDIDILVEPTRANSRRVHAALVDFLGPLTAIDAGTFAEPGVFVKLGRAPVRIDILTSIPAVRFETAWKNRVRVDVGELRTNFLSRRDLIRNKRAVGRTRDLADVEALLAAAPSKRVKQ
jgi:hypothetical protein